MIVLILIIPFIIIMLMTSILICTGCNSNVDDEYSETIFVNPKHHLPSYQTVKTKTKTMGKTLDTEGGGSHSFANKKQPIQKQQSILRWKKSGKSRSDRLSMIPAALVTHNPTSTNRFDSRKFLENQTRSMTLLSQKPINTSSYMVYSKQQPQESSSIQEQASSTIVKSSGSGYYAILMKQIKVKSVSQYGVH